ncbi:MAG: aminotransferase class I/II-fold pyridoxal phosphate-dependent enzyme [Chloroflexi bacterium]|nr:aminotransferase class I/II-fold pyridoxal phosphate-dependent enzyme [Chloroflexota bacterium]
MTQPLPPFKLERYFAQYEFKAKYLLSASDCEALTLHELLAHADPDSLSRWNNLALGYTESQGLPALREEVALLYPGLSADDVLIVTPEEGIYIAMMTLLKPGDHVIAISPAYQSLYEIARSRGCDVTPWRVRADPQGWHVDLDELAHAINDRTRLLVINFPHNPTGYLPAHSEWQAVIDLAAQHNLVVFSDEMYRYLEYDPALRLPPACSMYERGISLSGLSKSFALPGLRIGWLAAQDRKLMERWLEYKDYTTICSSAPSEVLALIALRNREWLVERNLTIIKDNLAEAERFFGEYAAWFTWRRPTAGSVAFVQWKGLLPVEQLCREMLEWYGVMIVPATVFDMDGPYFRLGLGRRNFTEAIGQVRAYLRAAGAESHMLATGGL